MRILFFSHYFPPEVNAPANRTFEHCRAWAEAGHDVHVVTCVPSHPAGVPFDGYQPGWYFQEEASGVHVHRVWTYLAPNEGVTRRTLNYMSFVPSAVWRAMRLGTFDVIVATSPQFFCAVAGYMSSVLKRTPWVFELRDLWPDSVAAVGAVRPGLLLRTLERLELRMYRHSARVACLTRSFMANLEERGITPLKLAFVPNGIDPHYWSTGNAAKVRKTLNISTDDVVVSYVGTIGMAHGLSTVLDAARRLRDSAPQVRFLIVGAGAELPTIRASAEASSLSNVSFTGLVPRDEARDYLVATDICLVTLRNSPLFKTVLPSKMFEAMAARKPILLAVDGEAREVLEKAGAGIALPPEDDLALAEAIKLLAGTPDRRAALGSAGQTYVAREFCRADWARRYLALLSSAASSGS